ncbi:MAG: flagellar export chaperone FliS [Terriglobales bacterium]
MNAAAAYQRRSVEGTTPVGLIVLMYQAAVVDFRKAIAAMNTAPNTAREIEARTHALNHLLAIVGELKRALDFERGGEVARNFQRLYVLTERLVLQASRDRDAQPLHDLLEQYTLILAAWRQVEARPAAPVAQAAWSA